jgi:NitT/TauT family transport system permease protein
MKLTKKILSAAAVCLLWLSVWQLGAMAIKQQILLPSPIETFTALINLAKTATFYKAVLLSLGRIVLGFSLGVIFGCLGAVLADKSKIFDAVTAPVLKIIKAVPVASFIILALVWFYSDTLPIFIAFLMVLPMIWSTVLSGLRSIDKKYLELAEIYRLSHIKTFFNIKLPFILPSFVSTTLTALGFAWKSGIAAEVLCRPDVSLGTMLQEAKIYISTPDVFALTAVVAILSLILEAVIKKLLRRYSDDKNR